VSMLLFSSRLHLAKPHALILLLSISRLSSP
jgi:hypothetical protein